MEACIAILLVAIAVHTEMTCRKEKNDDRRYNLEISSRQLAATDQSNCRRCDGGPSEHLYRNAALKQSANKKADEAAL